jgi:hypothetical protein
MLKNRQSILKLFMLILSCLGIQNSYAQDVVNTGVKESGNGGNLLTIIIVLVALILLFLYFKRNGYFNTKEVEKTGEIQTAPTQVSEQDRLSGEINAAIVMALYLYTNEIHDQEDPVITMVRVSRTYSPWSSKIYGLRKSPR